MIIWDSSDSNPRFSDLMLARESQSTHRIKNMDFTVPADMACFLTFYIKNNLVLDVETLSVVCSIFILPISLTIVACQHSLTILITVKHPSVQIPFLISLWMTPVHIYTSIQTTTWMCVNISWQIWPWNWWYSILWAWETLYNRWEL